MMASAILAVVFSLCSILPALITGEPVWGLMGVIFAIMYLAEKVEERRP
jgi:hypothetical protein